MSGILAGMSMYIINIIIIYIGCSVTNSEMETHLTFSMTFIFDIIISTDEKFAAIYFLSLLLFLFYLKCSKYL